MLEIKTPNIMHVLHSWQWWYQSLQQSQTLFADELRDSDGALQPHRLREGTGEMQSFAAPQHRPVEDEPYAIHFIHTLNP